MLIAAPQFGGIYNVPHKYRTRAQADNQSGAKGKAPGKQKNP